MRERLIELIMSNSCHEKECPDVQCDECPHIAIFEGDAEKIADLLLADGWIKPPCKVGDKVYRISTKINTRVKYIQETTISRIAIDNEGIWLFCTCNPIAKCVFGKTVFLTREEAEAALVNYESSKGGAE